MRKQTFWSTILFLFVLALICSLPAHCQDIYVPACSNNYACQLANNQLWANANQTWIFAPSSPNASIYIYVHNDNPTSAHTATIQVFQTGSTTVSNLSSNADQWVQDTVTQNPAAGASCNSVAANAPTVPGASGTGTCYLISMFAAQIAVKITSATAQAGSPDTFDLSVVQFTGYPGGPAPGADSSAGGGSNFGVLQNFTAGTVSAPPKILECSQGGLLLGCSPAFSLSVSSSVGRNVVASAQTANSTGQDSLSVVQRLTSGNSNATDFPSEQSSTNATASSSTTGTTLPGMQVTTSPAVWSVPVQAASASQCSASVAAVATTRHCAVGVQACAVATIAQTQLFVNLRDGATGAGTVKWNGLIAGTAGTFGCVVHEFAGGPVCGTINTAMTLELGTATAATNGCAVTVRGYDVQ